MRIAPLLAASPAIQIHAFAAMAAFALGLVQFVAPKGTVPHRLLGWVWVGLMAIVGVSAFLIHEIRVWGPWSPIHLLAIYTLVGLVIAVRHARQHSVRAHKLNMIGIFVGGLVIAGAFTFLPGRIMHAVMWGP